MPEAKGKYAAMIAEVRNPKPVEPELESAPAVAAGVVLPTRAKPEGKRSDPAWKQYAVMLKKDSHKQATRILRDRYEGTDMSDLMESLLANWLQTQHAIRS
jgi:hypothetical protein